MKRLGILKIALILLVLLGVPSIASADGITWTLDGVTFGDWTTASGVTIGTGGSASGSFVFDPLNPNTYSDISVSTTPWVTLLVPTSYTSLTTIANSNSIGLGLQTPPCSDPSCPDLQNISLLFLAFTQPLTNAGGTIPIALVPNSLEFVCLDTGCNTFDMRLVTSGEVSAAAVATPEPAAFLLLGIGLLALLIGSARRKVVSV
jgi:hypothetical protein